MVEYEAGRKLMIDATADNKVIKSSLIKSKTSGHSNFGREHLPVK